jgi:hypothetical protein
MPKSNRGLAEIDVKLSIGDWLVSTGIQVFDERHNSARPTWGTFEVRGISRGKRPDLVVCGNLSAAGTSKQGVYVAIEVKPGDKHHDILDGFDAVLEYFSDYLWGVDYWAHGQKIEVEAFVFATAFSPQGFLFKEEGKFSPRVVRGPWDAYPMTFTIARLLWRQRDNLLKRFQALSGIPRVEGRLKGELRKSTYGGQSIPEVGVLVRNPTDKESVCLMLSAHPYHFKLEGLKEGQLQPRV